MAQMQSRGRCFVGLEKWFALTGDKNRRTIMQGMNAGLRARVCIETHPGKDDPMGLIDFLRSLFGGKADLTEPHEWRRQGKTIQRLSLQDLSERLGVSIADLTQCPLDYRPIRIPKRNGKTRLLHEPNATLKTIQRTLLRRLLKKLRVHPAVTGFQPGHSIVHNALPHVGKEAVVRMDIRGFFPATTSQRIRTYFRAIGWDRHAAKILTQLCTHKEALPQGAPTSPRLSNLINVLLDARLAGLAKRFGGDYTRYADDLTFSFQTATNPTGPSTQQIASMAIGYTSKILADFGYRLNKRKTRIATKHNRQIVTGLTVNTRANLPRKTRRWLRAVEHRLTTTGQASLSPEQLAGWKSLQAMIQQQTSSTPNV